MDSIDRKIIEELQRNSALSNQELSERVNLSASPCLRRVKNLEKSGVLQGYTAIVDAELYGLPINAFIGIRLSEQTDSRIKEFELAIQDLDEVLDCFLMSGQQDYLLRVVSKNFKSYERFIRERLSKVPGISSLESNFVFGQVKRKTDFPNPEFL